MRLKKHLEIISAFAFTAVMLLVPWARLRGRQFADLEVYREYFLYHESVLDYKNLVYFIDYLVNEALWHFLVRTLLVDFGIKLDYIFFVITAVCILAFSLFLVRRSGVASLLLLVNPLLIDLSFSQLRIALAISLLCFAYLSRNRLIELLLVTCAVFIHTASVIFLLVFFFARYIKIYFSEKSGSTLGVLVALISFGIFISVVLGPLREIILGYLGDRRAVTITAASSLAYSSYWIGFLLATLLQKREFFQDEVNRYSVIILTVVAANVLTGGYTTRIISVSLPMLFSTLLNLKGVIKLLSILTFLIYAAYQWKFWLQLEIL